MDGMFQVRSATSAPLAGYHMMPSFLPFSPNLIGDSFLFALCLAAYLFFVGLQQEPDPCQPDEQQPSSRARLQLFGSECYGFAGLLSDHLL